jgi:hypothetical protein
MKIKPPRWFDDFSISLAAVRQRNFWQRAPSLDLDNDITHYALVATFTFSTPREHLCQRTKLDTLSHEIYLTTTHYHKPI